MRKKGYYIPAMILVEVVKLIVDINRRLHMLVHLFKREKFKKRKLPRFDLHLSSIMGIELIER